jgi:hypothetical protein
MTPAALSFIKSLRPIPSFPHFPHIAFPPFCVGSDVGRFHLKNAGEFGLDDL